MARPYHEKQVLSLCALHALNNLFQERGSYSKSELDEICKHLSPDEWINPHRSMLGLGNYDINVIMTALQKKGCAAVWFDKRKEPSTIDTTQILGFILNVPTDYKIGFVVLPLKRRHWIAIRKINEQYWNLDSKLDAPQNIGNEDNLIQYLKNELQGNEKELFIIVSIETEQTQKWLKHSENL